MTRRFLIFAPRTEDDAALWNSHWTAQQTAQLAPVPAGMLEGGAAVREALETALSDQRLEGVALFGHGEPHAVYGADNREALDLANAALIGSRWAHAMACQTGVELIPACSAHAGFFVGYKAGLIVEWTLDSLPDQLRERLARMVTAATLGLLEGDRTKEALQRRVSEAADDLTQWLLDNTDEGSYLGLHVFAQQLIDRMVVSR